MAVLKCKSCGAKNEYDGGAPAYMMSFGDMNTLLLTFFILLITMSTFEIKKFQIVLSSFKGHLGVLSGGRTITKSDVTDMGVNPEEIDEESFKPVISFKEEETAELVRKIRQAVDVGKIEFEEREEGLVIQVTDQILFGPGSAEITSTKGKEILNRIGILLRDIKGVRERPIRVEGHTDDSPLPRGGRFRNNWELSAVRATNVLQFLQTQVNVAPSRLSAAGYGSQRPIVPNDTFKDPRTGKMVDGRAKNRRIDIVVLRRKKKK